eukprot:COSAG06_NODE_5816_length_3259_cov_22.352532_2_plen_220_part_00
MGTRAGLHSLGSWLSALQRARGACCVRGALRAVAAVTRPCCLSDSLLCLCLCVFISLLLLPLRAGTVATNGGGRLESAVCVEHPMVAGAHYVEMTLLEGGGTSTANMGMVGQGFDVAGGGCASSSAGGWMLGTDWGDLCHAAKGSNWEGMPQQHEIKRGDVVGLLLDLGQRTLSVYLNGARWAVDVGYGGSVRIERRPPPGPVPSAEEVAAAVAWNEAN